MVCLRVCRCTRISVAIHEHSMQCRRLHSRAEGGEPRREHYAVHLAFSLINGGEAAANADVVAAAAIVFALVSYISLFFHSLFLSLSLSHFLTFFSLVCSTFSFSLTRFSVPFSLLYQKPVRFLERKKKKKKESNRARLDNTARATEEAKNRARTSNHYFSRDIRDIRGRCGKTRLYSRSQQGNVLTYNQPAALWPEQSFLIAFAHWQMLLRPSFPRSLD